jgi:uncharacterized membrane protein YdjX (TVP38/TMEM64 family)
MAKNNDEKKGKGGLIKIIIVVLIIGAVFAIAHFTGLLERLALTPENIVAMEEFFDGFGLLAYLIFIGIYILVAVFMLPAFFFTIIAGLAFGAVAGAATALVGSTLGAAVAFIVARYVARDTIVNRFGKSPLFRKIDDGLKANGVSFLILTRLVPVFPYNVQNYIYGLTPIKLGTFTIVSFITMAPGAIIYAGMAGLMRESLMAGEGFDPMLLVYLAAAGVILFLVSLIPKYIAKKKGIKLEDMKE